MRFARKLGVVAAVGLLLGGCGHQASQNQPQTIETGGPSKGVDRGHAGNPIPALEIDNPAGKPAKLPAPGGTPMLVNLWASWCAPCVKELPTLQALSQRPGAPQIIEVSEDTGPRASVDAFLRGHKIDTLQSWQDPDTTLTSALGAQVLPTSIYYDSRGREVWRYVGDLDWSGPEAAKLLSEGAAGSRH